MATNSNEIEDNSKEEIIRVARERYQLAEDASAKNRLAAIDDLKFFAGDQWPEKIKNAREREDRPCFTTNRLPQFVRQVTNDQRQNSPSNKVYPVDNKADKETAAVLQGMYRHIEYNSNAAIARTIAFDGAAKKGWGYYRIVTAYPNAFSFNQEILIKSIPNDFSVSFDPHSTEIDGSDANWAMIGEDVAKDDFIAKYKDSKLCSKEDWRQLGDEAPGWITEDTVRVIEYFYKDYEDITILLLSDGSVLEKSEFEADKDAILATGVKVVNERKSKKETIKWCKLNGFEVLEETVWPGKWIPIIPIYGEIIEINGVRTYQGIIRNAKDSQTMLNFWKSSEAETIALAPKAPFIGFEGQFEGHEDKWATANTRTHAYLEVKPVTVAGQPVGLPQRNVYEPPVQAITNASLQAADDLKATTGIYDSALGAQSREVSGVAIRGRQAQSHTSNYHFMDNFKHSMRHEGRIIVDLIPKVYDAEQAVRIIGEDEQQEIIWINKSFTRKGEEVTYNLDLGQYDVVCESGPSYATKRDEASQSMLEMSRNAPQIMGVAGDLIVKNMDWPGASEIAERLKKTLPPGIIDDPEKKPLPPEVQAQMQQMGQLIEQLTAKVNEQDEQIKTKREELQSKERIEMKKLENAIILKQLDLQGAAANAIGAAEIRSLEKRLDILNYGQPIDDETNQNFNEPAPDQGGFEQNPNPTGGPSPGLIME